MVEAAGRNLGDEIEDRRIGFALADDVFEVVALLESALELDVFFFGAVARDRGANVGEQLFVVPGLLDEVLRPGADGVDDIVDGAVGGDHDDRQIGIARPECWPRTSMPFIPGRARSRSTRS